jgi:hypothetical protein
VSDPAAGPSRKAGQLLQSMEKAKGGADRSQNQSLADDASAKRKFKAYPIGYFHIDIAELRTAEGKLYLFVAIDRTSPGLNT